MMTILKYVKGLMIATGLSLVLTGMAATASAMPYPQKDGDISRGEVRRFDQYLDQHPEVAEQLKRNPSLVNREDYREAHPELREFLKNHPEVREELKENPRAFMKREKHFDKRGNSGARPLAASAPNRKH